MLQISDLQEIIAFVAFGREKVEDRRVILLGQSQEEILIHKEQEAFVSHLFGLNFGLVADHFGIVLNFLPQGVADALLLGQSLMDRDLADAEMIGDRLKRDFFHLIASCEARLAHL
jgi:hypothetical protein